MPLMISSFIAVDDKYSEEIIGVRVNCSVTTAKESSTFSLV